MTKRRAGLVRPGRVSLMAVCMTAGLGLLARPAARQLTFRAGVDYVRVDAVVTGDHDRPITDLTRDDFEIVEGGRVQQIDDFQFVYVPVPPSGSAADAAERPAPPPPADVATNEAPSPLGRLFVLVIDDLHILESEIVPVKRLMTDFFDALAPGDEAAVVFVGHSNLGQNVTSDRALLRRTVDRVREALGFGLDALGRPNTSNLLGPELRTIAQYAAAADITLKNVARSVAGSGYARRAIVYVTAGTLQATTRNSGAYGDDSVYALEAFEAARRADVPIYTIDPRGHAAPENAVRAGIGAIGGLTQEDPIGLKNAPPGSASPAGSGGAGSAERMRALAAANIRRQQNRLHEVALNTGGRAFTDRSDLAGAVRELVADNGSYYLLGFYPSPFTADGKFHDMSVRVKRPGARVRARSGYVASSATAASDDPGPMLETAVKSGVNVSAIALRAFVAPMLPSGRNVKTALTLDVTYPPSPNGSRDIDDELLMSVVALDPDGKVKASSRRSVRFKGSSADRTGARVAIDDVIDLPSQPLVVRIAVASRTLGRAGSVQLDVDVPKVSDKALQFGGIALGIDGDARPAVNAAAIRPLVPFQPTTTRTFTSTDTLRVFATAFWRSTSTPAFSLAVRGTGLSVAQPILAVSPTEGGGRRATVDAHLPLAGLAAGSYVLEIAGQLDNGRPVTRAVRFDLR